MWREILVIITQLIVASPKAWKDINREKRTYNEFLNRFLHPLFGIIALTSFIGGLWISQDGNMESALKNSIISIVAVYGGYFIASYAINDLAPRFGLEKNLSMYQKFVGFASAVIYLLYIVIPFFPGFIILWVCALYTIHLVYTGAQSFILIKEDRLTNFTLIASALIIFSSHKVVAPDFFMAGTKIYFL
jgi:hypothetical protein